MGLLGDTTRAMWEKAKAQGAQHGPWDLSSAKVTAQEAREDIKDYVLPDETTTNPDRDFRMLMRMLARGGVFGTREKGANHLRAALLCELNENPIGGTPLEREMLKRVVVLLSQTQEVDETSDGKNFHDLDPVAQRFWEAMEQRAETLDRTRNSAALQARCKTLEQDMKNKIRSAYADLDISLAATDAQLGPQKIETDAKIQAISSSRETNRRGFLARDKELADDAVETQVAYSTLLTAAAASRQAQRATTKEYVDSTHTLWANADKQCRAAARAVDAAVCGKRKAAEPAAGSSVDHMPPLVVEAPANKAP